jgi:tetraacyldisaccharide 4'-kinase
MRYLLLPFAWLYGFIIRIRNWLFDVKIKKSMSFEIPVIGIGNLSAGGTGKTPMAEYILELLLELGYKPAMLSRGYKRQSKGYQVVKPYSTAAHVGDEPFQVKRKFPEIMVAVCEDRAAGVDAIHETNPGIDVIVLDDSYQHRRIKPGFNILLTDFNQPFYKDKLLPAGMLREPVSGKNRADLIIVTKCPENLGELEKNSIRQKINAAENQEIYFTSITYKSLVKAGKDHEPETQFPIGHIKGYKVILFTGIAKTTPLRNYLSSQDIDFTHLSFPDHHNFSASDVKKILKRWESFSQMNKLILTTEKDWRRMEDTESANLFSAYPLYFLPIAVGWDANEKLSFDDKIKQYVGGNQGND